MRKANFFKRTLSGVLALSSALTIGFFAGCSCKDEDDPNAAENKAHNEFIDEIGGVSETYKGTLSNGGYDLPEQAATAFVEAEIAGNTDVEVVNVKKLKALNSSEVAELNIPTTETIMGVEQYEVEYAEETYMPMATQQSNTKKVVVYLVKLETRWEYYSPCPVTGETITKSYYESVFDSEAYKNCTYSNSTTMTMNTLITASQGGQSMEMKMDMSNTMTQLIKYQEGKIYFEQTITSTSESAMTIPGMGSMADDEDLNFTKTETICAYIEEVDGEIICYAKVVENGVTIKNWEKGSVYNIGFSSAEDIVPFADGYLDYTYFTKTNFGFELSGEQAERYLSETLEELYAYQDIIKDMDIKTIVKYYVQNGALTGLRQDLTIGYDKVYQGANTKLNLDLVTTGTVKDYGTTVVTKPAEIVDDGGNVTPDEPGSAIG